MLQLEILSDWIELDTARADARSFLWSGRILKAHEVVACCAVLHGDRFAVFAFPEIRDCIKRRWASTGRAEESESSLDSADGGLASSAPVSPFRESAAGVRAGGGPRIIAAEPLEISHANTMR